MRLSLVGRVVGVVVAVAVVAIVATAVVVAELAEKATIDEVQRLFEQQDEIATDLELAALDAGSWALAVDAAEQLASDSGVRVVVRSSNGRTLLDTEADVAPTDRTRLSQSSVQILSPFDTYFSTVVFDDDGSGAFFDPDAELNRLVGECLDQVGALDSIELDDFGSPVPIATDPELEQGCINTAVADFYSDPDFFDPFGVETNPGVLVEDALLFLGYSGTGELAGLDSDLGSD
ncbi:MAG: hypothetical protein GXP35_04885, partial [Actinobacteria bacterium]|nr:hypothetical protein [Actinomycetota bacterium]